MPKKRSATRVYHRNTIRRLSKGSASPNLFIIIFIVLMLFFGSLLVANNASPAINGNPTQGGMAIPTGLTNTGGGLFPLNLSPYPTLASGSAQQCDLITNDIVLLIDASGSMKGVKLEEAKIAAQVFVQLIALNPESRVGLVAFDKTSTLKQPMSNNFPAVVASIDSLTNGTNTCIQCGALMANEQISGNLRPDTKRSVVLLSDGKANHVNGQRSNNAKSVAVTEAIRGYNTDGTNYYSIAFGNDSDVNFMQEIATSTGGSSYATKLDSELTKAFGLVASDICES